ncbi:hypothetical protein [Mycobacterium paragordonae]|uniref:hypothetical protein n=1 Tax=Mycobacterium paragordonae TaxID=1389713 RepID=UPI003B8A7287
MDNVRRLDVRRLAVRRLAAVAIMVTNGFGLAGTATALADDDVPWPWVGYHWCPGQPFNAGAWGPQFDPTTCHDAHHRDMDGTIHNRDYFGPSPFQDWPEIPNNRP